MANQNFIVFDKFLSSICAGEHYIDGHSYKVGFTTTAPDKASGFRWPTGFDVADFGGAYTAEIDVDLSTTSSGNTVTVTTADVINLAATDGSPTASHGVIYNSSSANNVVGYFALDSSPVDLATNNLTVNLGDLFNLTV